MLWAIVEILVAQRELLCCKVDLVNRGEKNQIDYKLLKTWVNRDGHIFTVKTNRACGLRVAGRRR